MRTSFIQKTFKREVAVILLLWFFYVVEVKDDKIIEILVWPVFTFVTAAFGLDQYSKLRDKSIGPFDGQGNERSSEYATGEDQYTDPRDNKQH